MNPNPLSSLNHFTVPVAMFIYLRVCALRNAEDAEMQRLRKRDALLSAERAFGPNTTVAAHPAGWFAKRSERSTALAEIAVSRSFPSVWRSTVTRQAFRDAGRFGRQSAG